MMTLLREALVVLCVCRQHGRLLSELVFKDGP